MGPLLFQTLGWIAGIFAVVAVISAVVLFAMCVLMSKEKDKK